MKQKHMMVALVGAILLTAGLAAAQVTAQVSSEAASSVISIINTLICRLVLVLYSISAGIALIVIVLAGIKWIGSSEDAGARAQAKSTIIHAIIGLIIVMIALVLVNWVVSGVSPVDTFLYQCKT